MPSVSNQPGVVAFSHSSWPTTRHRSVADGDEPGLPAAAGEQTFRGDGCRAHAWNGRRRLPQALDARAAFLGRAAARLEVQLRDDQRRLREAKRQPIERHERTQEQSGRDDQDE